MRVLVTILLCGVIVVIPIVTFVFGFKRLLNFEERYHRVSIAGLLGLVFAELTLLGMLIDPHSINHSFGEILLNSIGIGIFTFLFVLLFLPISSTVIRVFRK